MSCNNKVITNNIVSPTGYLSETLYKSSDHTAVEDSARLLTNVPFGQQTRGI